MEAQNTTTCSAAGVAAPCGLTPSDGKAFMDVILYGHEAGWDTNSTQKQPLHAGHKKLMADVIAARRYNNNNNISGEVAPLTAADAAAAGSSSASAAGEDECAMAVVAPGITDADVKEVLIEAKKTSEAAEATLANGLVNCENWMGLRDDFYHAGALFSLAGLPDDAARCLLQATYINRAFKDDDEALTSLMLSVSNIKLSHPSIAVESLERLAGCYERNGLLFQAARCLKDAAEMNDGRLDEKEAAVEQYTKAIAMYRRVQSPYKMERSLIDQCHERLCFLHTCLGHFEVSEKLFLEKANMIPSNLPATRFRLYATLAVLARGHGSEDAYFDSIYDTKKIFDALQEIDRGFQKGKENELVRSLLKALEDNSLNQFDIAVQKYNEFKTTVRNPAFDLVVERCRKNLFDHLENFA